MHMSLLPRQGTETTESQTEEHFVPLPQLMSDPSKAMMTVEDVLYV